MLSSNLVDNGENQTPQKWSGDPFRSGLADLLLEETGFDHCIFDNLEMVELEGQCPLTLKQTIRIR